MSKIEGILRQIKDDVYSDNLRKADKDTLEEYEAVLCRSQAYTYFSKSEFPQICEAIRLQLLRIHIDSLQSHITELDDKNTSLQKWVIALAIAALISTLIQTTVAIRAEIREAKASPISATIQPVQKKQSKASTPCQDQEP